MTGGVPLLPCGVQLSPSVNNACCSRLSLDRERGGDVVCVVPTRWGRTSAVLGWPGERVAGWPFLRWGEWLRGRAGPGSERVRSVQEPSLGIGKAAWTWTRPGGAAAVGLRRGELLRWLSSLHGTQPSEDSRITSELLPLRPGAAADSVCQAGVGE